MTTLIYNGLVIDPANGVCSKLNVLLRDGRVSAVTADMPDADERIDASGKIVCPGFLDIHMHEDPLGSDGELHIDEQKSILACMLRMGVTTAVAGNCGENKAHPLAYLDAADRRGAPVNLGMLAGHGYFRELSGATDKYAPATQPQIDSMAEAIRAAVEGGCLGVSYGIRYIPGLTAEELLRTAAACQGTDKIVTAHIRSDAAEVFDAAREMLELGRTLGVGVELSHIGSMAGFGQMEEFFRLVDLYRLQGLDVSCDCYPYDAFSTSIGSTTYDDGWLERYGCGYDAVELCEGKYKGQRCTAETFAEMRRDFPECKTVCYVMQQQDVDRAYRHAGVMLGSDGTLSDGQGHPRAAGAFPRFLARFARSGILSFYEAVEKMTALPARRLGLSGKGSLSVGSDADVVVFDPNTVEDRSTFREPLLPPVGINYVFVNGVLAARDGVLLRSDAGRAVRR